MYSLCLHSQRGSQASIKQNCLTPCCLLACSAYALILKMKATCSSKMSVNFYLTAWYHTAENVLFISSIRCWVVSWDLSAFMMEDMVLYSKEIWTVLWLWRFISAATIVLLIIVRLNVWLFNYWKSALKLPI
jgi:hypothetical protein